MEQTYYRKVRNNLFQLVHYVYSVSPRWLPMHAIISIFRLVQFLGPALVLGYDSLWTRGETITRLMEIVGVLFHLVPASYRHDAYIPILALYCALNVLSWGLIIGASFYYKTNAKLPNIVPSLVTLYLGSFGYLLHPIACQHAFEMLSEIISGKDQTNLVAKIVLFVLFIAFFIAQSWFFIVVTSVSLEFRPGSLTAMLFSPQVMMFMFTGVITAVTAVGTFLGKYPQIALLAVTAVLYLAAGCLVFHDGGFISMAHKVLYLTCSISGMVMLVINIVMLVLKRDIDAMIILIELAIVIVAVFISYVIISRFITKCLMELDYIADDESYFERYQSPRHVITMLIIGCQKAHPVCMELRIFEMAVTQFPHSVKIWAVYMKFVAIFPEQNASITLILQRIRANRLKGAVIKNLIEQSYTLLRLRDSNLSPELKRKLGDLGKKVQQTKHKIRHIWDMVIQGNVNEMEGSISRANSSVEMCIAEYAHVLHQYSNNRFLVRSYTRFNNEVLADHAAASEWFEKSRLLQRGIQTSPDNAHELGLLAMPLLPVSLSEVGGQPGKLSMTETDTSFATDNFDIDEDANQQLIQQTSSINECIKNLSIPAIRCTNIMRIVWLIVLFLIPLICLTVYIDFLIADLTSPLDFIYTLSYLRCLGFQVAVIGHRYVLENIPNGIAPHINRSDIRDPPVALGSTHDPAAQLSYLIKVGTNMIETLTTFSAFKAGDRTMDLARESVFGENMPYKFFKSRDSVETVQVSLQVGMMDVFSQLSFMLEYEVITPENPSPAMPLTEDILDTSMILNSVQNAETFGNYITDALTLVVDYIVAKDKSTRTTMIVILCLFCIGFSAILWISTIVELKMIKSNKLTVYRCLTSLPKNTVSTVAEDLRVLKKDKDHSTTKSSDPEAELNKQEESILKMLATSGDSSGVSTNIAFLVLNAFHMIAMIIAYAFFLTMVMNQSQNLVNEAPHVDYLLGAYTYDAGIVLATDLMLGEFYNLSTAFEISVLNTRFNQRLRTSQTYYARLLYGDPDEAIKPFQAFAAGLESAINRISCQEQNTIPESVYEAYECFRPDIMFYLHHNMVLSIVVPVQNGGKDIKKENPFLPEIYDMSIVNLYENFFYPMFSEAIPALVSSFNGATAPAIAIGFSMFVVAAIVEGIFISLNLKIQRELLFALRLLLHCPAQVVLQNGKIMNVLTGDFSKTRFETTSRSIQFFDDVVDQLPNACLILEPDARVFSVNQSGCRLFNKEAAEIRNEDVRTLLGSATCDKLNNLSSLTKQVDQRITLANSDGTDSFFNASLVPTQGKIVMTLTDITQQIRYNTLIQEERAKSDKLLSSILPADLVHRVQAGEKDISFSVQSASVMFVDIVEFTPWCASNTGAMVMSTLNALFKEFDSRLSKYSTLTKIKCIGDCYMAAGGIFSEVNQPTVHATEMVDFGLSVIEAVGVINKNLGLTLRVRAGVNTGGPVVAGVLGVGKPTFEILGPTINMAQQMEHHGVPMQVHISRPVYEYIYGSKFTIKERGNIEVKNGTVQTYLVSGKQK